MQPDTRAPNGPTRVWIVEDNVDYARTVQELIEETDGFVCPHIFRSGEEVMAYLNNHFAPEVVFVDIGLPGMNGIEVVKRLHGISPVTQLVMLTIHEDDDRIFDAICAGATGYLTKTATSDRIVSSLREVLRGGAPMTPQIARRVLNLFTQVKAPRWDYQLTDREQDVLARLIEGKTKKEIGSALFLSAHTVDTHMRNIYAKLHVHSRTEAVAKALQENLVMPDDGE